MTSVILAEFGTGQVLWSLLWLFMFIVWFWLLISIFGDLIRDREMSGWGKAAWLFVVIVFNWIGILIYLIVRGKGMAERAAAEQVEAKAEFDDYIRSQAAGASPAEQIAQAKSLHDSGAISDEEYAALKAKALS
jgi:hypothetical protein